MDRTTAACAGIAINSMFADSGGWGEMIVQMVKTGDYWRVEVRRQGDVYANGRGKNRIDAPPPAAPDPDEVARVAAELRDVIARWLESGYDNTDDTHYQAGLLAAIIVARLDAITGGKAGLSNPEGS